MSPGLNQEIWRNSPEYLDAFEEGYNTAKTEILKLIKQLEALKTITGTTSL